MSFRPNFEASDERSDALSFEMSDARSDEASFEMSDRRSYEVSSRVCFLRHFPANSETSFPTSFQRSNEEKGEGGRMKTESGGRAAFGDSGKRISARGPRAWAWA